MSTLLRIMAVLTAAILPFWGGTSWSAEQPAAPRPNIVYILADDHGWKDVGFHGSEIQTPALDKLAQGGARLEQFYTQPFCTPTRSTLMTGRYPFRYGLQTVVIPSGGTYGLALDEWLLPQALKEAGYATAIVGKWHLGHADRKFWPRQRGFDIQYGPITGEIDYFKHTVGGKRDWYRDNQPVQEEGYATELLGREAVRVIEKHDTAKPLFLYLPFTAPHAPYQAPQEYLDRYKNIQDPNRRAYAAMVSCMDDVIGQVVAALEKRGMRENTLIIFSGDNGGARVAELTGEVDTSKGSIPPDNGPYRDGKGSYYEGGTRVLALANWPGHVQAGLVVNEPIHIADIFPTLAGLAGASMAKSKPPADGFDVWSTISANAPTPRKEVVYGIEPFRAAVRQGDWKLVWKATLPQQVELFNLAQDVSETNNVAKEHPQIVAALRQRAEELAAQAVPPLFLMEAVGAAKRLLMGDLVIDEGDQPNDPAN